MPSATDAIERPFPFLRITSKSIYWKWICSPSFVFSSGPGIWGFCPFQLEPIYLFLSLLWPSRLVWKRFEIVVDQEGGGGSMSCELKLHLSSVQWRMEGFGKKRWWVNGCEWVSLSG